jgi:hypothetical protein
MVVYDHQLLDVASYVSDMERHVNSARKQIFAGCPREATGVAIEEVITTVDQSDIRGSEPQSVDPSGAASDYGRGLGHKADRIETTRILLFVSSSITTRVASC